MTTPDQDNTYAASASAPEADTRDDVTNAVPQKKEDDKPKELIFPAGPNHEERLARVVAVRDAGGNAFLEAAAPLLRCMAEVPQYLQGKEILAFNLLLQGEVNSFTRLCEQANLRRDHMLAVRYAVCTALDEVVNLRPWGGGEQNATGAWSQMALLNRFHGEGGGGNTVFLLIGRLANAPDEHMPVLEIIHHILGLGYKGDYRTKPDGPRNLETIRHRLYTLVSGGKQPVARELSPHWQGVGQGRFKLLRSIPVWVSASVMSLVLFAMFSWFKYDLLSQQAEVQKEIAALSKLQPPPAPPAPALKLSQLLATEIAQGRVRVDEDAQHAMVVFKGDGMFSGLAGLSKPTQDVLDKVGQALAAVSGKVRVVGHTDDQPVKLPEFPNNQALSLARAKAVAAVLEKNGVNPLRMEVLGMGDTQPVNGNAANRSANRRVELELVNDTENKSATPPASPNATPSPTMKK